MFPFCAGSFELWSFICIQQDDRCAQQERQQLTRREVVTGRIIFLGEQKKRRIGLATVLQIKSEILMIFRILGQAVNVLPVAFSTVVYFVHRFRGPSKNGHECDVWCELCLRAGERGSRTKNGQCFGRLFSATFLTSCVEKAMYADRGTTSQLVAVA